MREIERIISPLIQSQFPEFYQEEGPRFIDFIRQYYAWMEQENQALGLSRTLLDLRDIDKTSEQFLTYFNQKYMKGLPLTTEGSQRLLTKHATDLYHVKGTERGIQLVLQGLFDQEASVYLPGEDVFKSSDGTWVRPVYLELTTTDRTKNFIGKEVVGSASGAKAFVEGLVRRRIGGRYIDIAYLSDVRGNFQVDEYVTETSNTVFEAAPRTTGSMTNLTVKTGGALFAVGDVFDVESSNGKQGKARVTEISNQTGKVTFSFANSFADGGWGYNANSEVVVSSKMLRVTDTTNSNTQITNFKQFELVRQYLANIAYDTASNSALFTVGSVIENYYANGVVAANAVVVDAGITNSTAGYLIVYPVTSTIPTIDTTFSKKGNTVTGVITSYYNRTVTANVTAVNSTYVGVHSITGGNFYVSPYSKLYGLESQTTATISNTSTGTDATFDIGLITNSETVYLTPDFISSNNNQQVPFVGYGKIQASFNALTGVANTTDYITTSSAHGFSNGDYVRYDVSTGNNAITGLNNGGFYYIVAANTTAFKVAETNGGASVNVTAGTSETGHKFVHVYGNTTLQSINLNGNNSGAALQYVSPLIDSTGNTAYGSYGFTKWPGGGIDAVLLDVLRFDPTTIGSIASIVGIDTGNDYNVDPFIAIVEPRVLAYNRYDLGLGITGVTTEFMEGEEIQQSYSAAGIQLDVTGFVGTAANGTATTTYIQNEYVYQKYANGATRAYGFAVPGNINITSGAGSVKLQNVVGTFVTTSNSSTKILSQTSNSTANATTVAATSLSVTARGLVKPNSNTNTLLIKRINLENTFKVGSTVTGRTTGAQATLTTVEEDYSTRPIGFNANVTANVQASNGIVTELAVKDSGFGYVNNEVVTLTKQGSSYSITALVELQKQGYGEGFFSTTKGFLDSDKKLHDNDYYQEYSYEVQTKIPFAQYIDVLKQLTHVAGTKPFGRVVAVSDANTEITIINSIETS